MPSRVVIEYQQVLQDYSVLIKGRRLRPRQIEGLLQTVAPILHVEFDNPDNRQLYGAAQMKCIASGIRGGVSGGT